MVKAKKGKTEKQEADFASNGIAVELIKPNIPAIIEYCNNNPGEFDRLLTKEYSKEKLGLSYPFFIEESRIDSSKPKKKTDNDARHYWAETSIVLSKKVRVTSEWTWQRHEEKFEDYLNEISNETVQNYELPEITENDKGNNYKAHAISNSQNAFVRYLLSHTTNESFNKKKWEGVRREKFGGKCVYCGGRGNTIDHAIPINKGKLGEHRLGNIVPCCKKCNGEKSDKDYKEYLNSQANKTDEEKNRIIDKIEKYMKDYEYIPLTDSKIKEKLTKSYEEIDKLAKKITEEIRVYIVQ